MQNTGLLRRLAAIAYDSLLVIALLALATVPFIAVRGGEPVEIGIGFGLEAGVEPTRRDLLGGVGDLTERAEEPAAGGAAPGGRSSLRLRASASIRASRWDHPSRAAHLLTARLVTPSSSARAWKLRWV